MDSDARFSDASKDFKFATAVAAFGMLLRDSKFKGDTSYDAVLEIASEAESIGHYRREFLEVIRAAKKISNS